MVKENVVYFVQAGTGGPIKIGTTSGTPRSRTMKFHTGNHLDMKILAVIPGDRAVEKRLQDRFAVLCIRREWYQPYPDLLDFIAGILEGQRRIPGGAFEPEATPRVLQFSELEEIRGYTQTMIALSKRRDLELTLAIFDGAAQSRRELVKEASDARDFLMSCQPSHNDSDDYIRGHEYACQCGDFGGLWDLANECFRRVVASAPIAIDDEEAFRIALCGGVH